MSHFRQQRTMISFPFRPGCQVTDWVCHFNNTSNLLRKTAVWYIGYRDRGRSSSILFGCAVHSTSTRGHGCDLNALSSWRIQWLSVASWCTSQCFILPRQAWYQFANPGGMECLDGLDGKPVHEPGIVCHTSSDCAPRARRAEGAK